MGTDVYLMRLSLSLTQNKSACSTHFALSPDPIVLTLSRPGSKTPSYLTTFSLLTWSYDSKLLTYLLPPDLGIKHQVTYLLSPDLGIKHQVTYLLSHDLGVKHQVTHLISPDLGVKHQVTYYL